MKKALGIIAVLVLGAALGIAVFNYLSPQNQLISEDEAKNIAFADVDVETKDVTVTRLELERDDGGQQYEIEFTTNVENDPYYKYEIDAESGRILSAEAKIASSNQTTNANNVESGSEITAEQAKAIALEDVGLSEADITYITATYENEHRAHWNVEFSTKSHEYDYEIAASDGTILEAEHDSHH